MTEVRWKMIQHIDFVGMDKHGISKGITEVFKELKEFESGTCPHRPDPVQVLKASESNSGTGSVCVFCEEQIEIKRVVWGPKSKLPNVPRSA
jgi:hypothetical protein